MLRKDNRFQGHPYLRPHPARADTEASVEVCEGIFSRDRGTSAEADDCSLRSCQAAKGDGTGRLQPERLGPNAGIDLLDPATAEGDRINSSNLERTRARREPGRLSH